MSWLFFVILGVVLMLLLVFLAIAGFLLVKAAGPESKPDLPYRSRGHLLSPAERSFLGVLERALQEECRVMAKVRLADVIKTRTGLGPGKRQSAFNKIQGKHLDFVLCSPGDYAVLGAVELDDSSHADQRRKDRDEFVDQALRSAKIPIWRFRASHSYAVGELREAFGDELKESAEQDSSGEERVCPNCGAELVLRTAQRGEHKGEGFWGCSNFPDCSTIIGRE